MAPNLYGNYRPPCRDPANNSLLMFKRQSANNEGGATAGDGSCVDEQLQKQAPSSWKAQQPPVMETAAVDSKESKSRFC